MKKKFLGLFGIALLAFSLAGCGQPAAGGDEGTVIVTKYNVGFEVDGTRIKTLRIEAGQKITETITDPVKEGFRFTGWYEGTTLVDLSTYSKPKVNGLNYWENKGYELGLGVQDKTEDVKRAKYVIDYMGQTFEHAKTSEYLNENQNKLWFWENIAFLFSVGKIFRDEDRLMFNEIVGYFDKDIVCNSTSLLECANELVDSIDGIEDKEVMFIFYGETVSDEEAELFKSQLEEKYPYLEIGLIKGDQPVFDLLIGVNV